jgi:hypothetical protein
MSAAERTVEKASVKKSLYFKDPFMDISSDLSKAENIKKMKADASLITCPMFYLTDSTD